MLLRPTAACVKRLFWPLLLLATSELFGAQATKAVPVQPSMFIKTVRSVRYPLKLEDNSFSEDGGPILKQAIASAQYVLIGEDHISREIPKFTAVVCDAMAKDGLSAMAVEAGPQAATLVFGSLGKPDRQARMSALTRQYPDSVAFLDDVEENNLVNHCAEVADNRNFQLWGLDQEFFGSSGWLLHQVLETHPGLQATALLNSMLSEEQGYAALAKQTSDPTKLFLFSVSDQELAHGAALLRREGNAEANRLFHELVQSHEIYVKSIHGLPEANSQRAQLLKQHFRADFDAAAQAGRAQRVLLKFGALHLYKGISPLHQRDLGSYIAEFAEGKGTTSLHICIFGTKGTRRAYGVYGRPTKLEPFVFAEEESNSWLKPLMDEQVSNAWTLYDLRKLRFQNLGGIGADMERLIRL